MRHQIEECLQGETLNFQIEFTLSQLYPLSENIIICVDLVGELTDIGETLLFAVRITDSAVDPLLEPWVELR